MTHTTIERNDSMKKAYVKVKPKSVRSILGRTYIVATILGAALCAIVLSFVLKPYMNEEVELQEIESVTQPQIEEVIPEEVEVSELEPLPEVIVKEPPEILSLPEEGTQVGLFSTEEVKIIMPSSGRILYDYSDKPKKSEITGVWQTHSGIDISGEDVVSPADGKIKSVSENMLNGKTVTIDHGNGYISALLGLGEISVEVGQTVKSGEKIGKCGNSSPTETYDVPYVHFELTKNGKKVNPHNHTK